MKILAATKTNVPTTIVRPEAEMLIGLHKMGVEIDIITPPGTEYTQRFRDEGIRVFEFFPTGKLDFKAIKQLRNLFKNGQYDIFQSFHNKYMAIANIAAINLPVKLVGYRGIDFKAIDLSYLFTINSPRLDYLICLSKAVENNVKPQLWFNTKTVQIYKGQDVAWFEDAKETISREELGIPEDAFVVINVSNVRPFKGIPYLLNAMGLLPKDAPIHLLLVGKDTDQEDFKKIKADSINGDRIHLLGLKQDVVRYLKISDMYMLPTKGLEGLSRALMEALSVGLPALVTRSGGPEELVEDGVSGIHIPRMDEQAIADNIMKLYSDEELLLKMGKAAKERIETVFSLDSYVQNMYKFYQSIS